MCPADIRKGLADANGEDVVVVISSGGGDVMAGNEMAYELGAYKGQTTADISGFCGSAATIVACGAGKVRAYPSTMYMIHNVSSGASGDYHAMEQQSMILQTANKAISNLYRQKTGLSEKELLDLMDRETWMDAATAKEKGFVDEIIGESGAKAPFTINALLEIFFPMKRSRRSEYVLVSESDTGYDRQRTGNSGRKRTIKTYENEGRRIMKFMNVFFKFTGHADYVAYRNGMLDEAENLLNEGKLEEYKAKKEDVETFDNEYKDFVQQQLK